MTLRKSVFHSRCFILLNFSPKLESVFSKVTSQTIFQMNFIFSFSKKSYLKVSHKMFLIRKVFLFFFSLKTFSNCLREKLKKYCKYTNENSEKFHEISLRFPQIQRSKTGKSNFPPWEEISMHTYNVIRGKV